MGYDSPTAEYQNETSIGTIEKKSFPKTVNATSPQFETLYNQSYASEQYGLNAIAGGGYRKAIEFLIKDYAISKKPQEKEKIEKIFLGELIKNYVDDERIKKVAKRAAWLGNDEIHYLRKWVNKDLSDLKNLISLTLHCIEMEVLTQTFEIDMPE